MTQVSYAYDDAGNVLTVTDKKGFITTYTYDKNNRMKTVGFTANSLSRTTTYSYDRNGNRSSIVYDGDTTEEYTYDKDNRLTLLSNKRSDGTSISSYSYAYDLAGRIHTKTDSFGTTNYTYDADGRITQVQTPGKTSIYSYDKSGNRQSLNETYTSQQFSGYVDDTTTPQSNLNYLVKASEYVYSDANRLMQLVEKMYDGSNNEVVRRSTDYFYDANGNQIASSSAHMRVFHADVGLTFPITSSTEGAKVTAEVPVESKPLDTGNGPSLSISSDIGTAGDPLTKEVQTYKGTNAALALSISGDNGSDATTNHETVDETVSNQYDGFNRLKKSQTVKNGNVTVEYGYDGDDLRVKKVVTRSDSVNADVTLFLYDGHNVILETDGGEAVKARYVLGVNYVGRVDADGHTSYFCYNGHGDVVQTVSASGIENNYDYDVFGTPTLTVEGYSCPIRYAGSYYDAETGLDYMNARYMDAGTGRFISEDTYAGEDTKPLSLNLYTFCANDPVNFMDPTGHQALSLNDIALAQGYHGYGEGQGNAAFEQAAAQSLASIGVYTNSTFNAIHGVTQSMIANHTPMTQEQIALKEGYTGYGNGNAAFQKAAIESLAKEGGLTLDTFASFFGITAAKSTPGNSNKDGNGFPQNPEYLKPEKPGKDSIANRLKNLTLAYDGDLADLDLNSSELFEFTALMYDPDSNERTGLTKVLHKFFIDRDNRYGDSTNARLTWGKDIDDSSIGYFEKRTRNAVRWFAKEYNATHSDKIREDGVVDTSVWRAMKLPDPNSDRYLWLRDKWDSTDKTQKKDFNIPESSYGLLWANTFLKGTVEGTGSIDPTPCPIPTPLPENAYTNNFQADSVTLNSILINLGLGVKDTGAATWESLKSLATKEGWLNLAMAYYKLTGGGITMGVGDVGHINTSGINDLTKFYAQTGVAIAQGYNDFVNGNGNVKAYYVSRVGSEIALIFITDGATRALKLGSIETLNYLKNSAKGSQWGELLASESGSIRIGFAGGKANVTNTFALTATHSLTMDKSKFKALVESIRTNGINETIKYVEYNGEKYVVDGHHRLQAAKQLGIKEVPTEKVQLPYNGYKTTDDLFWGD